MRGQESKNRRNPLIYIRLSSVQTHLYPHFRSLCNQVSNLRPVRWIVLTFPNAKDTTPTANSSHARRGSSAASGCRRSRPLAPNEDAAALDDVVLQTILAEGTATVRELRRMLGFARGRGKRAAADPASEVAEEGKRGKSRSTRF